MAKVSIAGKEFEFHEATLGLMRKCARLERDIAAVDGEKMIDDDAVFAEMIGKWKELLGLMLISGESVDPEIIPARQLAEVKRAFFSQATPTK